MSQKSTDEKCSNFLEKSKTILRFAAQFGNERFIHGLEKPVQVHFLIDFN